MYLVILDIQHGSVTYGCSIWWQALNAFSSVSAPQAAINGLLRLKELGLLGRLRMSHVNIVHITKAQSCISGVELS